MAHEPASDEPEWISQRAARDLLHEAGLTVRQARRALGWGLGGKPLRTSTARLFDRSAVQRLTERESVDQRALTERCPNGVFVARLGEAPTVGPQPLDAQAAGLARATDGWEMALEQRTFLRWQVSRGPVPYAATVCGFVVATAQITGLLLSASRNPAASGTSLLAKSPHPRANGWCDGRRPTVMNVALVLEPAEAWVDLVRDRRLVTGPGPSWRFWQPLAG